MCAKIINPDMYKKTTRKKIAKSKQAKKDSLKYRKEKLKNIKNKKVDIKYSKSNMENNNFYFNNKNINSIDGLYINKNISNNQNSENKNKKVKNKKNVNKKKIDKTINFSTIIKISSLIICIGIIGALSKVIVNHENEVVVETDSTPVQKVTLVQDYDFKIGMSKLDTTEYLKSKNIVLNELGKIGNNVLISINKDYTINYKVAKKIEKLNSKEYFVEIDKEYDVSQQDIIDSIEELKKYDENIYYKSICNIASISKQGDDGLKINLINEDNYYIYKLDFPLVKNNKKSKYSIMNGESGVFLTNQNSNSTLKSIEFKKYNDSDNLINDFKDLKIDMFTATSDSIIQLIGKHDYNVKKYRDGQTIFLFGNKDSVLFSQKEVRQALAYCINRDEIVKKVNSTFSEVIDIPYIYSDIKLKYDVYGAQNVLLAQGWQKVNGLYYKTINDEKKVIELNLLVNENDATKIKIAEMIKEMVEKNGIRININRQKDEALQEHINNKNYDLILADVYINNVPDITFVDEYININDEVSTAIKAVENSNIDELPTNLSNLQNVISNEIGCIGILARNTSVVYQKNINGFNDIGYMKIFDNLEKIGKIQEIKSDVK